MDDLLNSMPGVGRPPSSSRRRWTQPGAQLTLTPPTSEGDKKDLVTFLEALSSVLPGRTWLDFSFVNNLDGAVLSYGASFSVRRHILQRRIHSPPHRLVPGSVVILKVAHGFSDGRIPEDVITSRNMDALVREIQILAHPVIRENPNVVDLLQLLWEFEKSILRPVLILEYANRGTLTEYLRSGDNIDMELKKDICRDVARGISALHKCGILHCDIKCDNILIFQNEDGTLAAKVTDFGFSTLLNEVDFDALIKIGGTHPFTAPEATGFIERHMLLYTDYFSYGMLVWQLLLNGCADPFRHSPFHAPLKEESQVEWESYVDSEKAQSDFLEKVKSSIREHSTSEIQISNLEAFDWIFDQVLCYEPTKRSMKEALEKLDPKLASEFQAIGLASNSPTRSFEALPDHALLDLAEFSTAPFTVKAQIVSSLKRIAENSQLESVERSAQASFLLSQCYLNGFGVRDGSDDQGREWLVNAAKLGHTGAQEVVFRVHEGIGVEPDMSDNSEHEMWLTASLNSRSRIAAETLLGLMSQDPDLWGDDVQNIRLIASRVKLEPPSDVYPISITDNSQQILEFIKNDPARTLALNDLRDSILHWAATNGLDGLIPLLLEQHPQLINSKNVLKETPLLFACRYGRDSTVNLLLDRGASIEDISLTGETPLHWLGAFPDDTFEELGTRLVNKKAMKSYALQNDASTGHFGDVFIAGTPLHRAVALRRLKVVQFLLDNGADHFCPGEIFFDLEDLETLGYQPLNEFDSKPSYLPIHWACQAHDMELLLLLFRGRGFMIPEWPSTTQLLLDPSVYADAPIPGLRDFWHSVGDKPSEFSNAVLEKAMAKDDGLGCRMFFSRSMLSYAADPLPWFSRLALYGRRQKLALEMTLQLILSLDGQTLDRIDWVGKSAITQAAFHNDPEIALHLLTLKDTLPTLEKSYQGGWGTKPLHIATSNDNLALVRALLERGADPLSETSSGLTALHVCASQFFPDQAIAEELIEKAPSILHLKNWDESPFSTAVRNHDFHLADLLRRKGADPNQLLGPHNTNTVLLQILMGNSMDDLPALSYLLDIPEINFVVAPHQNMTALHAASLSRIRYNPNDEFPDASKTNSLLKALLRKWHSCEQLSMKDKRGMTALHYAAVGRDRSAMEQLVEAMESAGSDINTLSNYYGSPVNHSALDYVGMRQAIPEEVIKKGQEAVENYQEKTEEMQIFLRCHGAKSRQEVLDERWDELSWFEKQKARLLSSERLSVLARLTEVFDQWRLLGPDVKTTRQRIDAERNPEEIKLRR